MTAYHGMLRDQLKILKPGFNLQFFMIYMGLICNILKFIGTNFQNWS